MKQMLPAIKAFFLLNWPQKLGALLAAVLVWWFATVGDTPQTQASRVVSVEVQGLGSGSVASGIPDNAVITIRGPSVLIERLQAQNLAAVIDLEGRSGDFEQSINVLIPQGVELVSVTPGEVIGTVETLTEATVPVDPVLIGARNIDTQVSVTVEPTHVTVSGLASVLGRVTRVLVPVRGAAGERSLAGFAADLNGLPVNGATVLPAEVLVTVTETPVLERRTLTINFVPPAVAGFNVSARLDQAELTVVGPPSQLAGLEAVNGTADAVLLPQQGGTHVVPVELALPDGVIATRVPQATVRLLPQNLEE